MESTVLIEGFNGANTEIAKNLVLTAINVTINDDRVVDKHVVASNFLFGDHDAGKPVEMAHQVMDAALEVLRPMNPLIKIASLKEHDESVSFAVRVLTLPTGDIVEEENEIEQKVYIPSVYTLTSGHVFLAYLRPEQSVPTVQEAISQLGEEKWHAPGVLDCLHQAKTKNSPDQEWCPIYSVGGSILSQEIVSIIKDPCQAARGWLIFDALSGSAQIHAPPLAAPSSN